MTSNSKGTSVGVPLEQNYPSLVREKMGREFEGHRILISGWNLGDLFNNFADNVLSINPNFVVLHFGIIESTQRILSNWEKRFHSLLPWGGQVTGLLHRNRAAVSKLRHSLGLEARQVSLTDYSACVRDVADCLVKHQIPYLFLQTPLFPDQGKSIGHPFINQDVTKFNGVLDEYSSIRVEALSSVWTTDDYLPGTVHFSEAGHKKIAELLIREIEDRL